VWQVDGLLLVALVFHLLATLVLGQEESSATQAVLLLVVPPLLLLLLGLKPLQVEVCPRTAVLVSSNTVDQLEIELSVVGRIPLQLAREHCSQCMSLLPTILVKSHVVFQLISVLSFLSIQWMKLLLMSLV
jgi:hypothetical protein